MWAILDLSRLGRRSGGVSQHGACSRVLASGVSTGGVTVLVVVEHWQVPYHKKAFQNNCKVVKF